MKIVDEFKEFIARGNVMDMAVGIIVGGAFTAIVNSLERHRRPQVDGPRHRRRSRVR